MTIERKDSGRDCQRVATDEIEYMVTCGTGPVLVRQQEESESGKNKKQEKYKIVKCPMPASTTYVEQSIFFRNSDIVALGEQLSAILQNVLQFGRHHR